MVVSADLLNAMLQTDAYLSDLLKQSQTQTIRVRSEISGWLQELRQKAAYEVAHQQLPTRRDEEWQFTDLSELKAIAFQNPPAVNVDPETLASFTLPEARHSQVVFINGVFAPELSDLSALPPGVFVGNLMGLPLEANYDAIKYIDHQDDATEVFTALNSTGFPDVAVIWAEANLTVETPIHLLWLTVPTPNPALIQPRGLIIADPGSSLTVIEQYGVAIAACSDFTSTPPYLNNAVVEVFVRNNARVNHTRYQRESGSGFHIGKTVIVQERDSHYTTQSINFGAKLSRHHLNIWQKGPQTETFLKGLTLADHSQTADTHSLIALNYPHGITDQLHKCIVDAQAHAIFSGKVFVPQAAQQTQAAQLNRNLLLSPQARVNTQPQLQITADNVKCTHGATVSQIDADELFYLQSRGINAEQARDLLLDAFAAEVLDQIPLVSLRQRLSQCVACRTEELFV